MAVWQCECKCNWIVILILIGAMRCADVRPWVMCCITPDVHVHMRSYIRSQPARYYKARDVAVVITVRMDLGGGSGSGSGRTDHSEPKSKFLTQ
jgi:hypothetical protein